MATPFAIGCLASRVIAQFGAMNTSRYLGFFVLLSCCAAALADSTDLGHGFRDHGVAAPISNHRGLVCTTDGHGKNVVLLWLMDHRGGYALLMIDAQTGKSVQVPVPFKASDDTVDSPYASILSRENKFYSHFNGYFVEFDPAKGAFTFSHKTAPQMAMSMTEDDNGVIWSASYPQSGLVSFNPKTQEFHDFGHVYAQNWNQYPRCIAADDKGYVYFAIGSASSQIVIFDPKEGRATPLFAENDRKQGAAYLYRDLDGKVYGQLLHSDKEPWYELYQGSGRKLASHPFIHPKSEIAGTQSLSYANFPDGAQLRLCDLANRKLAVMDNGGKSPRVMSFDYSSEGADIMGAIASPDGTITGGTTFPMRRFTYDPKSDRMTNSAAHGQWNAINKQGSHILVAGYPGGYLLDWDTTKPWVATEQKNPASNPALLVPTGDPDLHRPTHVLATPDGKTLIYSGTPDYGYTGGGIVIYDRASRKKTQLTDKDLVPDQSTESFVILPDGALLAGTTTSPGTGGIQKAREARMYLLDLATKKIQWQSAVLPGVREYTSLHQTRDGQIYGIADRKIFFVFDPSQRAVVYQKNFESEFGPTAYQQGPRILISGAGDETYLLLRKGIAGINSKSHEMTLLTTSPVPIICGGDYLDGRVYFVDGSHLCSWEVGAK
jgi:hypothetical protein